MDCPAILQHTNYRQFLKEYYAYRKKNEKRYSYHQFSEELSFSASNFIYLVILGKRNLSTEAIKRIQDKMSWTALEAKYFQALVLFEQATKPAERKKYHDDIRKILKSKREILHPDQFQYFSTWYIPVLKEIISLKNFVSNLNWISRKLKPHVDEELVRKGLQVLERLKMICNEKGVWKQNKKHLATLPQVSSAMISHYHHEMLSLAEKTLEESGEDRDISAMTMGVTQEQYAWVKKRVIEFRDQIQLELQQQEDASTMVAQLNMQLFPVTEK